MYYWMYEIVVYKNKNQFKSEQFSQYDLFFGSS